MKLSELLHRLEYIEARRFVDSPNDWVDWEDYQLKISECGREYLLKFYQHPTRNKLGLVRYSKNKEIDTIEREKATLLRLGFIDDLQITKEDKKMGMKISDVIRIILDTKDGYEITVKGIFHTIRRQRDENRERNIYLVANRNGGEVCVFVEKKFGKITHSAVEKGVYEVLQDLKDLGIEDDVSNIFCDAEPQKLINEAKELLLKESIAPKDNVNHPSHYNQGKIECIEAIESATIGKSGIEAVCVANVIKYLWRYEQKGGKESVEKAKWYLEKLLEKLEEK